MKLYLSSYRIPDLAALTDLVGAPADQTRVALITNAKDYYWDEDLRGQKIDDMADYFASLTFEVQEINLNDYKSSQEQLKDALKPVDLVWAMGGNTFVLRQAMERSGFEAVIRELLTEGKVYGGDSAGAIVAGNSLRGIEFADDVSLAEEVIWEGMKLVDKFVLPHVGSPDFKEAMERAKELHSNDPSMIELTDSQALVINGSGFKIVSAPE